MTPDLCSSKVTNTMREELVKNAVSFLNDPQVADTSLAKRVEFLESKELTKEEIEEALKRANAGEATTTDSTATTKRSPPPASSVPGYSGGGASMTQQFQAPPPLPQRDWKDYFVMATVTAGIGYGIYEVARRYVVPLINPPTPSSLEADKSALEAEFSRAQTLLDQMQQDTEEVKKSEQEREDKFQKLVKEVEDAVDQVKSQTQQRDSDMKLIKSQVENIKEGLPKSLEKHRNQQDSALNEVQDELKSLKQLLSNRMKATNAPSLPSASSVPSTIPGLMPSTNSTTSSNDNANNNSGTSTPFVPTPAGATTTPPTNSQASSTSSSPAPSTPKAAGIPAWQLAAQNKAKEESSST